MNPEKLEKCITTGENLTGKLLRTADQLDEHNKNVHIANVFGSTIGIIGAEMAIIGAILIPFTLGAGAIFGIIGAAIGAAGGVTAGGAKLARYFIKKFKLDELSKEWKSFQDTFNITNEMLVGDASFYWDALAGPTTAGTVASLGTAIAEVAPSIGSGAVNVAGNTARLAAIATSPLLIVNVLLLPLNICELLRASVQLYRGQGCKAGLVFRKVGNVLQKLIDEAKKKLETLKGNGNNVHPRQNTSVIMKPEQRRKFIESAQYLQVKFLPVADQLDEYCKDVNIAKLFGSVMGIIGGGLAITGIILIPFTMGAGAIISIVGGAIGAAGGATSGGASLFRYLNKKSKLDDLNKEWENFQKTFNITHKNLMGDASFFRDALAVSTAAGAIGNLGSIIAKVAPSVGSRAVTVAGNAARLTAVAVSSLVIGNALLLSRSIYDLVTASVDVHRNRGCDAGLLFRQVVRVLQELIDEANKEI